MIALEHGKKFVTKRHSFHLVVGIQRMWNPTKMEICHPKALMENLLTGSFRNAQMSTENFARNKRSLLQHRGNGLGQIIREESSGPRIVAKKGPPEQEPPAVLLDCEQSKPVWAIH
jgi:hypothetical protein